MASHELKPDMKIKSIDDKVFIIKQVNGPLVAINYENGNFAGIINISRISFVMVNDQWEKYVR